MVKYKQYCNARSSVSYGLADLPLPPPLPCIPPYPHLAEHSSAASIHSGPGMKADPPSTSSPASLRTSPPTAAREDSAPRVVEQASAPTEGPTSARRAENCWMHVAGVG